MKKVFTTVIMASVLAVSALAVTTVHDVSGVFKGLLNIGGDVHPDKEVYILPGVEANTVTFILPNFKYGSASLGDIVLVNIPMADNGQLTLESMPLYIKAISERAEVSVLNGIEDGGTTYNSIVSSSSAQVLLSIVAPSVPEPIFVLFEGTKVTDKNYAVENGGFEGSWSENEAPGWHSFPSATGDFDNFVTENTNQFQRSTEKRPGSTGSQSALIQSNLIASEKANGNCTNGQINAGSMNAGDAENNYNFSDPSNNGYNTAFVGQPDSLVFWAKYIPADNDPSNPVNKARAHVAITTAARYQDPETGNSASVKIADAAINYSATSSMGWQRLSAPFIYTSQDASKAAYMLITFTTNMTPGGGTTYSTGGLFNKKYYYDNVYLDDVEMIYNHSLTSLSMNGAIVSFLNGEASSDAVYSDSDYDFSVTTNGKAAKSFVGYDAVNNQVDIYVVADNYSQAGGYSVYTLQMSAPVPPIVNTEYAYSASTCDNEPYSDGLFSNLTEAGTYTTTIPNTQGGDSVITLTLTVHKTYALAEEASIRMDESYSWREKEYTGLVPGIYYDTLNLQTQAGCDSVFTFTLTVKAIDYAFPDQMTVCQNEEASWHGKVLSTDVEGTIIVYDSLQSVYGTDSVYSLALTILPVYSEQETLRLNSIDTIWHGQHIADLPAQDDPYVYYDSLKTITGCDSVFKLLVYISEIPITFGTYEAFLCEGDEVTYEDVTYTEAYEGDIHLTQLNSYGGDSIVHLTIKVLPNYQIDEYMTITAGDNESWEGWNLSMMPVGTMTLNASYYTEYDCDSTLILHLTVVEKSAPQALPDTPSGTESYSRKVVTNGRLYIIRKDEKYTILGTKIK